MKYANKLRMVRADRRISQLDLAIKAGIARFRYWQIENGYIEPTADEKAALAVALDTAETDIFPAAVAS